MSNTLTTQEAWFEKGDIIPNYGGKRVKYSIVTDVIKSDYYNINVLQKLSKYWLIRIIQIVYFKKFVIK